MAVRTGAQFLEGLRAVRRIVTTVKTVGVDVVEVSPPYDGPGAVNAEPVHRVAREAIRALAWRRSQEQP